VFVFAAPSILRHLKYEPLPSVFRQQAAEKERQAKIGQAKSREEPVERHEEQPLAVQNTPPPRAAAGFGRGRPITTTPNRPLPNLKRGNYIPRERKRFHLALPYWCTTGKTSTAATTRQNSESDIAGASSVPDRQHTPPVVREAPLRVKFATIDRTLVAQRKPDGRQEISWRNNNSPARARESPKQIVGTAEQVSSSNFTANYTFQPKVTSSPIVIAETQNKITDFTVIDETILQAPPVSVDSTLQQVREQLRCHKAVIEKLEVDRDRQTARADNACVELSQKEAEITELKKLVEIHEILKQNIQKLSYTGTARSSRRRSTVN
jgi:hypothetical protein